MKMMMMMMMMITRSLSNTAIQTAPMARKKSRLMRSLDGQHGRRYLQFGNVKTSSTNHAKLHRATQPLLIFPMKISANRSELFSKPRPHGNFQHYLPAYRSRHLTKAPLAVEH